MSNSSDHVHHTITLTKKETHVLTSILRKIQHNAINYKHGCMEANLSFYTYDFQQIKHIFDKLKKSIRSEFEDTQVPIDMATVNAAFDRIRAALNDADNAINHTNTVYLTDEEV